MSAYKDKKLWVLTDVSNEAKDRAKKLASESRPRKKIGQLVNDIILNYSPTAPNPDNLYSMKQLQNIENLLKDIKNELKHIDALEKTVKILLDKMPNKTILDKFFKW